MSRGPRTAAGPGHFSDVSVQWVALLVLIVLVAAITVGAVILSVVVGALLALGVVVLAVDRILLAVSPSRRARRETAPCSEAW